MERVKVDIALWRLWFHPIIVIQVATALVSTCHKLRVLEDFGGLLEEFIGNNKVDFLRGSYVVRGGARCWEWSSFYSLET